MSRPHEHTEQTSIERWERLDRAREALDLYGYEVEVIAYEGQPFYGYSTACSVFCFCSEMDNGHYRHVGCFSQPVRRIVKSGNVALRLRAESGDLGQLYRYEELLERYDSAVASLARSVSAHCQTALRNGELVRAILEAPGYEIHLHVET